MDNKKYAYLIIEPDGQITICRQDEPEISLELIHSIIGDEFLTIVKTNSIPRYLMAVNDEGYRLGLDRNQVASVLYHRDFDILGTVVVGVDWCDEREDIEPDFYAMPMELASFTYNALREHFEV